MCKMMSGYAVVTGGNVKLLISEKTDSHTEIAKEFGLRDTALNSARVWAWEFYPNEEKPSPDVKTWTFSFDSDATCSLREKPDEETAENIRSACERAAKKYVHTKGRTEVTCRAWCFLNAKVVAWENSSVEAWGNAKVEAWGNAKVEAWENSSVVAWENSSVVAWENSSVVAWGNAKVVAWGNVFIRLFGCLKIKASAGVVVLLHNKSDKVEGGRQIQLIK